MRTLARAGARSFNRNRQLLDSLEILKSVEEQLISQRERFGSTGSRQIEGNLVAEGLAPHLLRKTATLEGGICEFLPRRDQFGPIDSVRGREEKAGLPRPGVTSKTQVGKLIEGIVDAGEKHVMTRHLLEDRREVHVAMDEGPDLRHQVPNVPEFPEIRGEEEHAVP